MLIHSKLLLIIALVQLSIVKFIECARPTFDGIWSGQIVQPSPKMLFDVVLTLDSKTSYFRNDYGYNGNPTYCGGVWKSVDGTVFQESITYGSCMSGFVRFEIQANGLAHFQWFADSTLSASGFLTRVTTFID